MKTIKHALNTIWDKYSLVLKNDYKDVSTPNVERYLADAFTLRPYYYYVLNVTDSTLSNFHPDILTLHGLKEFPRHLKEIIDLIHPDDLPFVLEAEAWSLDVILKIGVEHQLNLKTGYCFRMQVANNKYELFHHQAIHIGKDENGKLIQAINIHTNIQNINTKNNYIATVKGIGPRDDFYQKVFRIEKIEDKLEERLTKRELEILILFTRSFTNKQIAEILCISYHTVRTHHKNILKKTKSKNSFELLKRSLENGYL